jgi:hypothetical protein
MPGLDQTGPEGRGAMTGRRMGRCTNYGTAGRRGAGAGQTGDENKPGDAIGREAGRGLGPGRGRGGRGRGRGLGLQNRFRGNP